MAVTLTGTLATAELPRVEATNEGQTIQIDSIGGTDFDTQTLLQSSSAPVQYLNNVIAVWAASTGQDARSSMVQIRMYLDNMLTQPEVGVRAYEP